MNTAVLAINAYRQPSLYEEIAHTEFNVFWIKNTLQTLYGFKILCTRKSQTQIPNQTLPSHIKKILN